MKKTTSGGKKTTMPARGRLQRWQKRAGQRQRGKEASGKWRSRRKPKQGTKDGRRPS